MSDRTNTHWDRLNGQHAGALLPYVTACYPDAQVTEGIIRRADSLGAAAIEIGFPFSDAIADGPVIQGSFHAVLESGHTCRAIFDMIERIRSDVSCALIAMVSYSIVHRIGADSFVARAAKSGFDGVIFPDVPAEESRGLFETASEAGLCYIGLIAPTTSGKRRELIVRRSTGFVYQIAAEGTTGERGQLTDTLEQDVASLREVTALPVCVGFGIATADQVREVVRFADGAIVGSAIVRRITEAIAARAAQNEIIDSAGQFIAELMKGVSGEQ